MIIIIVIIIVTPKPLDGATISEVTDILIINIVILFLNIVTIINNIVINENISQKLSFPLSSF